MIEEDFSKDVEITKNSSLKYTVFRNAVSGLGGALLSVCLVVILGSLLLFVSHKTPRSRVLTPKHTIQTINICLTQYTGYPLITDILTAQTQPNLGVYQGTITTVDAHQQTLTLASTPSEHLFVFAATGNTQIFDYYRKRLTTVSTIVPGTKAVISFPCKQQFNSFQLTQIQLVK